VIEHSLKQQSFKVPFIGHSVELTVATVQHSQCSIWKQSLYVL